ncbi:MAG: hypothetical protein IJF03_05960 [Lachnospiraceae bacterium]|nr:hypothetical protein [Lachnospiraceae bacterium]
MKEFHPDRESYEIIWKEVIEKEINNFMDYYYGYVCLIPNAKEEIWRKYVFLNKHCKVNYMVSCDKKIDRHKIAACYMKSVLLVAPLRFSKKFENGEDALALNERLAITVGLSLVCAFAISAIKKQENITQEERQKLIDKFDEGIKIPSDGLVNHGDYVENYCKELFFNVMEGDLSILSLAHELYLLEIITRIS